MKRFVSLPRPYSLLKDSIQNQIVRNIYSNFNFRYYQCKVSQNSNDDRDIENYLYKRLIDYPFITYCISNISLINNSNILENNLSPQIIDIIICVEDSCFIIERINISLIHRIFSWYDDVSRRRMPEKHW